MPAAQPASGGGQSSPIASAPTPTASTSTASTHPAPGLLDALETRNNLLGDMGGLRSGLAAVGISYGINETSEVLANVTGGLKTGPDYDGLTLLSVGLDTDKAFGWHGGTFNVSALWIHGRNLSLDNLGVADGRIIQTPSGIEAERSFRLWEAWFDQATSSGNADIKIGQQSLDQEFITSTYTTLFMNTMMGWPALPSYDMYAGGPAYPLSSLGVRVRGTRGPFTGLLGVYDDNPPGGSFSDDDQLRGAEREGVDFNFNTGALVIGEVQFALNQPSTGQNVAPGTPPAGLPGTYRIGAWFDSGGFPDQRTGADGLSLADPSGDGQTRLLRHDFALYTSDDQQIWHDAAGVRSLGMFARLMGAPGDRNEISFSTNLGLSLKAPLRSRPGDSFGIGYGLARVSSEASALDQDRRLFSGNQAIPIRSTESFIEVTYQAQVTPWWSVQPDFQYVFTPGGGIANPDASTPDDTVRIANEAIIGLRTSITF
ncbi:carbohydrate porin [Lichenicoccus sp.]|uniref:carbohydrate porin n=1 Tax=Lichenicoccus sp. TaxID=2781899 RepID=UPI003D0C3C51